MSGCAEIAMELGLAVEPGYLPIECCNSCHDDHDETGEPLILTEDGAEVCCAILRLYDDS